MIEYARFNSSIVSIVEPQYNDHHGVQYTENSSFPMDDTYYISCGIITNSGHTVEPRNEGDTDLSLVERLSSFQREKV